MDIKFRITKYLAVSALAMLLLGACSKNNIYINYPDEENNGGSSGSGNDDNNGNPVKENALVTFQCFRRGTKHHTSHVSYGKRTSKLAVCLYSQHIEQYHRRSRCSRQLCHLPPRCTDRKSRI